MTTSKRRFKDHEDIKAELRRRGITMAALARAYSVTPSVLGMAFVTSSKRGEEIIAEALGLSPHEVFPDRWAEDGTRLYARYGSRKVDTRQLYKRADRAVQRLIAGRQ